MLFNSVNFIIFFPIFFLLYWFIAKNRQQQNIALMLGSYFFYGFWDIRFCGLLLFSTLLDYFLALKIANSKGKEGKIWLWSSIGINVGFLGIFKYYNFFASSFVTLLAHFGLQSNAWLINIVLPVGISFYTFHGLSYIIDVYKARIEPERNFMSYAVFVSFFPLLVAGPIERATHLLPQIQKMRVFNYEKGVDGLRQILWGFFKKLVVADSCAEIADKIFNNHLDYGGSTIALGAIFFAFQIYGDFSGYSDIALGVARLLGIELIRNFANPYFSRDIAEFWRRWHISLTSWFRDYVYFPLGGSKQGLLKSLINTFVIFILSGFWHGSNWTFLCWGAINALYFLPLLISNQNRKNLDIVAQGRSLPSVGEACKMVFTFSLVTVAWIFFRAENMTQALSMIASLFSKSLLTIPYFEGISKTIPTAFIVLFMLTVEWVCREDSFALSALGFKWHWLWRWSFYAFIIFLIGMYMPSKGTPFMYFQF